MPRARGKRRVRAGRSDDPSGRCDQPDSAQSPVQSEAEETETQDNVPRAGLSNRTKGPTPREASRAGGKGKRGWSTTRYSGTSPKDIAEAKIQLAHDLDKVDLYDEEQAVATPAPARDAQDANAHDDPQADRSAMTRTLTLFRDHAPSDGQPLWQFLQDMWPYGYPDRTISDIFARALTLNTDPKKNNAGYCTVESTIRRLGFARADVVHVRLTFEVAFKTMLALELHSSGHTCLPRNRRHLVFRSQAQIWDVLKSNLVIRAWMEPPASFYDDLHEVTAHGVAEGITEVADRCAERSASSGPRLTGGAATIVYLRRVAAQKHSDFVDLGIDAVMQQLWQAAGATWLQSSKQKHATTKSQWEELRTRCFKDTIILSDDDPQEDEGLWLPSYKDGMSGSAQDLIEIAKDYTAILHERRIELQDANEKEKARTAALEAEAARRMQARRKSKRKGKGNGGRQGSKRARSIRPMAEDGDEEFDELESSSDDSRDDDEVDAEEAIPADVTPVKGDTWKTKAEGKTWDHAKQAESLVRHLEATKNFPRDVDFADALFTKVDLQDSAGSIAVAPDLGELDANVEGLDGKLTSDECLRALSFLFKTFPNAQALREAEHFRVPPASELVQYQPFDLGELGFRACPLTASGRDGNKPLRLSQTQLQAGLWFFRRVARDVRETNVLENQFDCLSEVELFLKRDWAKGGIIADPPGLGKTVIAILFALIYRKLEVVNKPNLFMVKASVSHQYAREVLRFVDCTTGENPSGGLHLLNLTGSDYESKRVPRTFKPKDSTTWNGNLLVVAPNKILSKDAKKDSRCPYSKQWEYASVNYDEVHDLPRVSASVFPMEFQINRHFTIGHSGTPIRNIEHFLFVLAFCGHPTAKIANADKAKKLGRTIASNQTLVSDEENVGKIYRDHILHWAEERDSALTGNKNLLARLENLISRFSCEIFPRRGGDAEEMRTLHRQISENWFAQIETLSAAAQQDLANVTRYQKRFHEELMQRYIFPMCDRTSGPFILKRKRAESDALPPLDQYSITIDKQPSHDKHVRAIEEMAKKQLVNLTIEDLEEDNGGPLNPADKANARQKATEKAEALVKNANYQHYAVYHPALLSTALQDQNKDLDLEKETRSSLAEVPSKKALLLVSLAASILKSVDPLFEFPEGCPALPVQAGVLPAALPGERPQKIVLYVVNAQVAMFVMFYLAQFNIQFLNLYGGDDHDIFHQRVENWSYTPTVPILIISAALSTGINITQANILIYGQGSYSELEDLQVLGRIYRTGQTRRSSSFKLRVNGSHDENVRLLGKAKTLNQAPFEGTSPKILEFCETGSAKANLREYQAWAIEEGVPEHEWPLTRLRACGTVLPSFDGIDETAGEQEARAADPTPEESTPAAAAQGEEAETAVEVEEPMPPANLDETAGEQEAQVADPTPEESMPAAAAHEEAETAVEVEEPMPPANLDETAGEQEAQVADPMPEESMPAAAAQGEEAEPAAGPEQPAAGDEEAA